MVKNMIKRKETFFAEQEHSEVHIIPETQLSQNDEGEDVQVSTEKNIILFHGQGALHRRDNQN